MKNHHNLISSTLKTIACDNIVSEYELTQANDKNLQDILNEQDKQNQKDKERDEDQPAQ